MKIEIRTNCKECNSPITSKRFRTFCSPSCRNKFNNRKYAGEHAEWQRQRNIKLASVPNDRKVQCLICGGWYVQLCGHTTQAHGVTAREYKEEYELEVKKGVVPSWYREMKGEQALENGTFKNLKAGAKFRFKKGQKGVGIYKRSPITIERIRNLGKKYGIKKRVC